MDNMELNTIKIIKDDVENEVYCSEITEETSPFKEILEKGEYNSYKLSLDDKTYSLEDTFHLLINVNFVGEFSFFFALDGFKKKDIILKLRDLKSIEVVDEVSAQKKLVAMFKIINAHKPIFLIYSQKGEYILGREGLEAYANNGYPIFRFGVDKEEEEEEEIEEEIILPEESKEEIKEEPQEESILEEPVVEEVKVPEEKPEPEYIPASEEEAIFNQYLVKNFSKDKVRQVRRILDIKTKEEEVFYNYLINNYSPEQVGKVCKALGIRNPLAEMPVEEEEPVYVTKEEPVETEQAPVEEKVVEEEKKPEKEKKEKGPNKFVEFVKSIWRVILECKFSALFILIAALIVELAVFIGFNYAAAGKGISVFFFVCALIGAGLNGFVYFDLFKEDKVNKKVLITTICIYVIGALIGLGGYAIFHALQKENPDIKPSLVAMVFITLLISFAVEAIAVLAAKLISDRLPTKK